MNLQQLTTLPFPGAYYNVALAKAKIMFAI